ncbi:hypothetical protein JKP75_00955 [Blastococcus sp. TML/M2B]|uniref:hypothetical protein n=1 Tax=unclassified Blastococcus TaxID=2619396 RepID=UPI00190B1AAF|nr:MULTISPECIES: hypothetical protein [unclassified Blastococcus]MBN1091291.1 hypothetical protein [Blastococcus sp. TML/M2B]MBN1095151.1 hypothetical protein [Blastococcus sp. TML/C7B]
MSTVHVVALAWPILLVGAGLVIGRVLRRADRAEEPRGEETPGDETPGEGTPGAGAEARTPQDPVAPDVPAER